MKKPTTPAKPVPVEHPGMGAVPYGGGITFRLWAPHADHVFVIGEFNDWSKTANPLAHDGEGYWSVDVPGAKSGQQYKFVIYNGSQELSRNDPYAREMTQSNGNSIVHSPEFDWSDDHFDMPAWNMLVIYEMHIGTFNRKNKESTGTFATAIERLPYLKDLGINAIEIMPPMEFPGSQSWGYNPDHPFALEHDYGGAGEFSNWSRRLTSTVLLLSWTLSIITLARAIWIYGNSMAGAKTARAASISITIGARRRRGARRGQIMAAARCGSTFAIMP